MRQAAASSADAVRGSTATRGRGRVPSTRPTCSSRRSSQTELALRRAERLAGTTRSRAQKQARRRFLVATLFLAALVAGVAYLVWLAFVQLFGG